MRPVYRNTQPDFSYALSKRSRTHAYDYKVYGSGLLQNIGEYCSYCEAALCGNAAVEHLVAKSTAPQLENKWENYLLACVNCNSTKGYRVATVEQLQTYLWPCDTRVDTFAAYEYYWDTTSAKALVRAKPNVDTTLRASSMLTMLGLNNPYTDDDAATNRRIDNRTAAWTAASALADQLTPFCATNGTFTNAVGQLVAEQIAVVAQSMGFWSVWMTVFTAKLTQGGVKTAGMNALLDQLFVRQFAGTYYGLAKQQYTLPPNYTGLPA